MCGVVWRVVLCCVVLCCVVLCCVVLCVVVFQVDKEKSVATSAGARARC